MSTNTITVHGRVKAAPKQVWKCWTTAADIMQWHNASEDWHTPSAEIDLREGGRFSYRMAARDGSFAFDYSGAFETITEYQKLVSRLDDDRQVIVEFRPVDDTVEITQTFEVDTQNSAELQQQGWQAILDNFCTYAAGN